ncbi:MAG: hypothetical protein QOD84_170 [Acidobacteriaceae bacterium]|jgi:uncharacterized membrane protein
MSQKREASFDRTIALVLRIGAFAGFFIMLAGITTGIFVHTGLPLKIETVGVLAMLITPVVRVFMACVLFLKEKDWRYGAISFGVLLILLLGAVYGIGEH